VRAVSDRFSSAHGLISSYLVAAGLSLTIQPRCETCHREIADSFTRTGMGRSVGLPSSAITSFRHEFSDSKLSIVDGRHRLQRGSFSAEYPALLRIGSGRVGSSFAVRIAKQWFQSPISWYAQSAQFRISPGYEHEKYPDFDRRIRNECLYCHSSGPAAQPAAITCARCHGNGQIHASKPTRDNIVNPLRLNGPVRDSVCEQCHLPGAVRVVNPHKRADDFVPGQLLEAIWSTYIAPGDFRVASHSEQLAASACMKTSASRLWCGTCHNPHPTKLRPAVQVDTVCEACHQPHEGGRSSCASCHMPKRNVKDVVHTSYTDHRIQRSATRSTTREEGLRQWRPAPGAYTKRNLALAWFEWAASTRDPNAMERASVYVADVPSSNDDAQVLSAKGALAMQKGAAAEAIQWYLRAVQVQPQDSETHFRLGRAEHAAGRPDAALKRYNEAIRLDPLLFDAYVMAAQIHRAKADWPSYRRTLEGYLKHVPQSLSARQALTASPH
jgi:hypothetical protein